MKSRGGKHVVVWAIVPVLMAYAGARLRAQGPGGGNSPQPQQVVVLHITPRGFVPPLINLPAKRTLVIIKNRTGEGSLTLEAVRPGAPQRVLPFVRQEATVTDVVDFAAGEHQYRIPGRPSHVATITAR